MKRNTLTLLIVFISTTIFSQVKFEKGYFIDNNNQKISCYIKNKDWNNNPVDFQYKINEETPILKAEIDSIKEFGIDNVSKFERMVVEIDKSSDDINSLSQTRNPIFKQETLFLKVLIEGDASLYYYKGKNLTRFFYKIDSLKVIQLVYKKYIVDQSTINTNNYYKQQLVTDLKSDENLKQIIIKANYAEKDLINVFSEYNKQSGGLNKEFNKNKTESFFNISIRPGANLTSLFMKDANDIESYTFNQKITGRIGIEAEFVLPFNKNKWSFILEPTFQYYNDKLNKNYKDIEVKYTSIELPIGIRYNFILNEKSKLFINGGVVSDIYFNSFIQLEKTGRHMTINTMANFYLGLGYNFIDRYSIEFRYATDRELLGSKSFWSTDYKVMSFVLGYTIFKKGF